MMSEAAEGSGRTDGRRRRRVWSANEKQAMLAESLAPGASVTNVALRYGVNANLLVTWRRQLAEGTCGGLQGIGVRAGDRRGETHGA
jgi:transposase